MTFILLSANEAGSVSGPSTETPNLAALRPVELTDGRFILGDEVLTDPAHAEHLAFLSTLPTVELAGIASLLPTDTPAPSLGARMLSAVKSFFAPDPVG
jgi:hypothetical protein